MSEMPHEIPDTTERRGRFITEERAEEFLQNTIQSGIALSRCRLMSDKDAYELGRRYVEQQAAAASDIEGMHQVLLRVSGTGVKVNQMGAMSDEEGRIIFNVHPGTPLVDLEDFNEKQGRYEGMVTSVVSFADDTYGVIPHVVLKDKERVSVDVNSQYGFPLSVITIEHRMLAACDGSAVFEIPSLATYRNRNKAIAELAMKSGRFEETDLMRSVHRINSALYTEEPDKYITLRHIEDLRQIGRVGKEYARRDSDQGNAVVAVLRETLGNGRFINLKGEVSVGPHEKPVSMELAGAVIEVLPAHPGAEEAEPTLVISRRKQDNSGEELYYVPVSSIEALQF